MFKFKQNLETIYSSDYLYDLFYGGYIDPQKILQNPEEIIQVDNAIETIQSFLYSLEDAGILVG